MPELAQAIQKVSQAQQNVERAQEDLDQAREELREALRAAYKAGASYALLGRLIGTSRQYVSRLISGN